MVLLTSELLAYYLPMPTLKPQICTEDIVIIQQGISYSTQLALRTTANLPLKRQDISGAAATIASTVTISSEANARLAAEKANESVAHSANPFRVDGPVYTLEEIMSSKGGKLITYKMTDAQVNEIKLRGEQEKAREAANFEYAKAHQYQPVGQVIIDNKVFATVYDSGNFELARSLPGLSEDSLNAADRLTEIAHKVNGEIITTDLLPTFGSWSGASAPESMLPPFTARSLQEILMQDIWPAMAAGTDSSS